MIPIFAILVALLLGISALLSWRGMVVQQVERRQLEAWTAERHAILARETVARTLFALLWPLRGIDANPPKCPSAHAVILVPDPVVGRQALWFLQTFLRQRGLCVWRAPLPAFDQPLHDRAAALADAIHRMRKTSGATRVDLVGFGVGGLIAAWGARHAGLGDQVRVLITLGTPWRGTRMAVYYKGALALEALPGSQDLDGLIDAPVSTLSIWCPDDPEVVPAESACAHADHSVAIDGAGHLGMLLSARTFRAVYTGLTQDDVSS